MKYRTMPPATIRTMHPHSLTLAGSLTFLFPLSVACHDPLKLESEGHVLPHGTIVLHVRDITHAGNGPRFQSHKMDDCRKRSLKANFLRAIDHTSLVIGRKEHLPDQCLYCCDADRKWRTPDRNLGHWEGRRHRGSRELKSVTVRSSNLNCGADDLLRLFSWIYQGYDSNDAVFHWQVECVIEYQLNAVRRRVQGALFSKAFGRAPLESEQGFS